MRIRRRRSSARSLPRKATRPPARPLPGTTARYGKTLAGPHGETLAGPPGKALAKDASRATARPAPTKFPPSFACSCQLNQLSRHLRGNMQLPGQLVKCLRGGMQIFVKAPPPRHLSCLPTWHRTHRWPGRLSKRGGAATDGMGLAPVLNKAKGHLSLALNVSCHVTPAISSR